MGYQRIAELSGDSIYDKAAEFFWHTVADTRSLSIGGNSRREHFAPADDCISYATDREGPESCNTNNMLKLSEGLFRMTGDRRYSDFYELALFNHILSTQHPGHGGYVYFTSARPGHYRVYSQPNSAMWCCVGTGMENHGKYGQFIYTHDGDDRLQVNLFIPSQLQWKEKGVTITQNTDFPDSESSRITVNTGKRKNVKFSLSVRRPGWCDGMKVSVNGQEIKAWTVFARYMESLEDTDGDGIANIPQIYTSAQGRKIVEDSTSLKDLLKQPNKYAFMIVGVILAALIIIILLVVLICKIVRKVFRRSSYRR